MDVMMPEMDRLTAAQDYQRNERDGCRQDPDICNECQCFSRCCEGRRAGMNEHLSKPSDETNMMRKIRGYITR